MPHYFTGVFSGILISIFGMRKISLFGGIMASLGFILSYLASSIVHLYICIGIVAGTLLRDSLSMFWRERERERERFVRLFCKYFLNARDSPMSPVYFSGIGTSFMTISSTAAVSQSFSGSKRLLALSIQNAGVSVGSALTPYLFDYLMKVYRLNGLFLLMGGIYLNCLPAAFLFYIPTRKERSSKVQIQLTSYR